MHHGNNHGVNANHVAILIKFHGDLSLAIGTQLFVFVNALGQPIRQGTSQRNGHGHQLRGLGAGTAKHHALVTGTAHLVIGAHGDIGRLGVDAALNLHRVGIEAVTGVDITDSADGFPGNAGIIHLGAGGDFAADEAEVGSDHGLTGDTGIGILGKTGIQDGIGNGVRHLIGVAIGYTFRGENSFFHDNSFLYTQKNK